MFNEGKLVQSVTHKTTDLYASEDAYDPTSGRRTFAVKKQTAPSNRRPAKISPRARYFDLLPIQTCKNQVGEALTSGLYAIFQTKMPDS